ncbi:hypothetical protein Salmuc_03355 [Salipiger mucosus DSM 16094]|uniref:Tetratricopeptide repeat protein n=1 Tax=Salipiger mucosus DSM 16094 TaxID=1123237 RepID=S9QEP6_9RHOB|nr:hypothetical protein Salmuc_03355 [Salipiger mucosus DSM 16094]
MFTALTPKPIPKPDVLSEQDIRERKAESLSNPSKQPNSPASIQRDHESQSSTRTATDGSGNNAPDTASADDTENGSRAGGADLKVSDYSLDAVSPAQTEVPAEPEPAPPVMPERLDLDQHARADFSDDRSRLMSELARQSDNVIERMRVRLDLGTFLLSHLMVPEGLSAMEEIPRAALPETDALQLDAVSDALTAASGSLSSEFRILDDEAYADWPGFDYWNAVRHLSRDDYAAAEPFLEGAFRHLQQQPDVHKEAYLKRILEGAIETGNWSLARTVAEHFDEHPDMKDTPAYHFLIGRAAKRIGRTLDAFDAFRQASLGEDAYAQRARLAIVDIGLETGAMPLEDAERFLRESIPLWQGDKLEIQALERFFEVSKDLDRPVQALLAISKMFRGFPHSEESNAYRSPARDLLMDLYEKGQSGEISLSEFAAAHRQLVGPYRYFPGFDVAHGMYAETLRGKGATSAAANEYRDIADHLDVARDLDIIPVDKLTVSRAYLNQAEALVAGSQFERALGILEEPVASEVPDIRDRALELKAEAHANLGDEDEVLAVQPETRTPRLLRMKADAYAFKTQWREAVAMLEELRSTHPDEMTRADAVRLLLASHRADQPSTAQSVLEAYPDLFESDAFRDIASGMIYASAPLSPLKRDNADARIDRATQAIEAINASMEPGE